MTQLLTWSRAYAPRLVRLAVPDLGPDEGQTLAEYALILALIAAVVVAAVIFLQGSISGLFSTIGDQI